jgi:hypothetical protein
MRKKTWARGREKRQLRAGLARPKSRAHNALDAARNGRKIKLWLNSPHNVRVTLARMVREVAAGHMDVPKARCVGYLCGQMIKVWGLENEFQIATDITLIKRRLGIEPEGTVGRTSDDQGGAEGQT